MELHKKHKMAVPLLIVKIFKRLYLPKFLSDFDQNYSKMHGLSVCQDLSSQIRLPMFCFPLKYVWYMNVYLG